MTDNRKALIEEYVTHRIQMGDWDEEEEAMTNNQRRAYFRSHAQTLTNEQLVSICNSYAMAD